MSTDRFAEIKGGSVKLNSGYHMPLMGLGTYKITGDTVIPAIDAALEIGYRCFDTAIKYGNEAELGEAFEKLLPKHGLSREDIFITSKLFPSTSDYRDNVRKCVAESLKNLRTDYIDLYLVHYPTYDVFLEEADKDTENVNRRKETYLELCTMRDAGHIRSVGISNFEVKHIQEIIDLGSTVPAVLQVEFQPHFTREALRKKCTEHGIAFSSFGSLARMEERLVKDSSVVEIASRNGVSVQDVLLAFALNQHIPVCPKSASKERLRSNFDAINVKLSQEDVDKLLSLNKPGTEGNYIRAYGWRVV